jgi:hypothetical protein
VRRGRDSYYEFGLWGTASHRAMAEATHDRMLIRISQMLDLHGQHNVLRDHLY